MRRRESTYYYIKDNILYVKIGIEDIKISTNVLFGIGLFCSLRGWLNRVGDIDLCSDAHSLNRSMEISSDALATLAVLNEHQINIIKQLGRTLPNPPDPMRIGTDYSDIEKGIGIAITQITSNSEAAYLEGLNLIFSPDRARAILDEIILLVSSHLPRG
jgi:hypothetical protein